MSDGPDLTRDVCERIYEVQSKWTSLRERFAIPDDGPRPKTHARAPPEDTTRRSDHGSMGTYVTWPWTQVH